MEFFMTAWKIQPIENGWWLFKGTDSAWWHVYHSNWLAVYPTLDAVFDRIKEQA
jgi:hypothetical protein